jgi:hypothetical protein
VTPPIPSAARAVLAEATLCYLAARTPTLPGPHLTPVVFAVDGGRLWLTTSRSSVKARAWRQDPTVAGLVGSADRFVVLRGRARIFDALDPFTWPAATLAGPRLVRAAARFAAKNARFFAGYAVDARRVPLEWTPPGRVFVEIRMTAGRVIVGDEIAEGWGRWEAGASFRSRFDPPQRGRGVDLRVPKAVRRAVGDGGAGVVALEPSTGALAVLPVCWRRVGGEGMYEATLPRSVLELAGASDAGRIVRASLTVDDVPGWRASEMTGMLLQGPAEAFAIPETLRGRREIERRLELGAGTRAALVRLRPVQAVWWQGWSSATVSVR